MNILVVSPVLPYGPCDGDRIRIFNIVKQLKERGKHRLFLVSFIKSGEEKHLAELSGYYDAVETVKISKTEIYINAFKSVFRLIPLNTGSYENHEMEKAVKTAVEKYKIDHVFTYRLRCAQFTEKLDIPKSIDLVDSLGLYMERSLKYESNPLYRAYYAMDRGRVLKCERKTAGKFNAVFINSDEDGRYIGSGNIITAPNGADIKRVKPKKTGCFTVGFFGNIKYRPNFDGVMWFLKNVWKKLANSDKNIKLVIAGAGGGKAGKFPPESRVEVKGFVKEIDALVASWDASVVPVRFGAGRQNKIMQSWANMTPVVATSFSAAGVCGRDGYNLLIADSTEEFTEKVLRLKNDRALGRRLKNNGTATLKKYFDWKKTGGLINTAIKKTIIQEEEK